MDKLSISLDYHHAWIDHPLLILFSIDDKIFHIDNTGSNENKITKTVALSNADHQFKMEIRNKNYDNVVLDKNGKIVTDSFIEIKSFCFDNFEMADRIAEQNISTFYVDNNNLQTFQKTLTFGNNGTLIFPFKIPLYSWILSTWYQ